MLARQIEIEAGQTSLREWISLVQQGTEIVLTEGGTPVARLLPVQETSRKERILGMHPGSIQTSDDFDEPLPDEFWLGEDK